MALLHVLTAAPKDIAQADSLLRAVRHALPRTADGRCVLLLCDLPDASALRMPEDDALIRHLQSGMMSMERLRPGGALLLVRRRAWDDAMRLFLGRNQALSARQVLAQLITAGETDAIFEAASFTPGVLRGRFSHILMQDAALSCAIDTPRKMAKLLETSSCGCVYGEVRCMPQDNAPLLAHLIHQGFSLSPRKAAADQPAMYTPEGLVSESGSAPATGCIFALRRPPSMRHLLQRAHMRALRGPVSDALLPITQTALLLLSAALGSPLLALAALAVPELSALRHLSKWPSALVRAALLPLRASAALDALLRRAFARARLRPVLPLIVQGRAGCVLLGAALLALALSSVHALPLLLPLSLFWIFSPLILRALELPGSERIPLTEDETLLLRDDAESLLLAKNDTSRDPGLAMLAACGACMLSLLEPDEAARRIDGGQKALADQLSTGQCTAQARAAVLTSAQFLRKRMGQCDAALRTLPTQLEALVLAAPQPQESSLLARLLRAAMQESTAPLHEMSPRSDSAADALFLPHTLLLHAAPNDAALPLTHPHTFAKRRELPPDHERALPTAGTTDAPLLRALCLASSALNHPFRELFLRSPVIAPVAAELAAT